MSFTFPMWFHVLSQISLYKSTNPSELKGGSYMLPWHAIPFLKALGMLTPKPSKNGWPRLWQSCKWQKNTQLIIQWLRRIPIDGVNGRRLVRYKNTSVAQYYKTSTPYQKSFLEIKNWLDGKFIHCYEWWSYIYQTDKRFSMNLIIDSGYTS